MIYHFFKKISFGGKCEIFKKNLTTHYSINAIQICAVLKKKRYFFFKKNKIIKIKKLNTHTHTLTLYLFFFVNENIGITYMLSLIT